MLSLQEFDILNFLFKNQDKEYTQEEIVEPMSNGAQNHF